MTWLRIAAALVVFAVAPACTIESDDRTGVAGPGTGTAQAPSSTNPDAELDRFDAVFATYASDPQNGRQRKQFRDAFQRVRKAYVHPVGDAELINSAIAGIETQETNTRSVPSERLVEQALDAMTASLDPHSVYLNREELQDAEAATSGEFGGLGIQVALDKGRIKIIAPIEGTPAERAGLKGGDVITHVNGRALNGSSLTTAVHAMRGPPGTRVRLTIERGGERSFQVTLKRAVIAVEPVKAKAVDDVGYIRISSFSEKAADKVEAAVADLLRRYPPPAGIVIDLRNNPGGLFEQSLLIADAFLDDGLIVAVRGRDPDQARGFQARRGDVARGLPIVVLINGGSASAAEIVASALGDHGRATLMGTRTFGKGSVQTVMRLPVEGALKLTTGLYYAPSGDSLQGRGVTPDVALVGVDDERSTPHEADLPGALPGDGTTGRSATLETAAKACPAVADADDPAIACAVAFLKAGSRDRFANLVAARSTSGTAAR
jgi:carboxyl-terminal processing protease